MRSASMRTSPLLSLAPVDFGSSPGRLPRRVGGVESLRSNEFRPA